MRFMTAGRAVPSHAILLFVLLLAHAGCDTDTESRTDAESADFIDSTAKEHAGDSPTANDVAWLEPAAPVFTDDVVYGPGSDSIYSGYMAWPRESDGSIPGVIVIHEWWGLNDNVRAMTRRIAGDGYMALAVDLYGGRVATVPDSALAYVRSVEEDPESAIRNLGAAIEYLHEHAASRIAVVGWCFGGGWSLRTALNYPEQVDAVVMYYGKPVTELEALAKLEGKPLLGIFGGKDQSIPVEQVREFEKMLKQSKVETDIRIYEEAGHAFANPSGERYVPEAAKDAWDVTSKFLSEHLRERHRR